MPRLRYARRSGVALVWALCLGSLALPTAQQTAGGPVTVFENARLIPSGGQPVIERSAFIVQGNRITAVGHAGELQVPAGARRVDLAGKTVMPAIVDTHSHVGYFDEVTNREMRDDFSRERLLDHLDRFAYTGHALTYSLGSDAPDFIDARYSRDPKSFVDLREESERDSFTGARYLTVGRGLAWPYLAGAFPTHEYVYTLGRDQPGTYAPYRLYRPPVSVRGAAYEAATAAGLSFIVP